MDKVGTKITINTAESFTKIFDTMLQCGCFSFPIYEV